MKLSLPIVAVLVTAHVAAAETPAEQLFRQGKSLVKAGKLDAACDAFERSDQLEPRVGTLLNLANCRELQGRVADAWALFVEAKMRALLTLEPRAEFAAERAAGLERTLAFLTLDVAPVDGLVVKRAGVIVPEEKWNMPAAIEPSEITIEASAPDRVAWSVKRMLKPGERITIAIEPLAVAPAPPVVASVAPAPAIEAAPITQSVIVAPRAKPRYFAVGAALGVALGKVSSAPNSSPDVLQDDHVPVGLRAIGNFAVDGGALRAIGSVLYTKGLNDKTDSTNTKKLYVMGLAADYVYMPRSLPRLAFAAGLGIGWDYEVRAGQGTDLSRWETLRASPIIFRLAKGAVELGLHTQVIHRGDGVGFIGVAAVDVFLL